MKALEKPSSWKAIGPEVWIRGESGVLVHSSLCSPLHSNSLSLVAHSIMVEVIEIVTDLETDVLKPGSTSFLLRSCERVQRVANCGRIVPGLALYPGTPTPTAIMGLASSPCGEKNSVTASS